MFGLMQDWPLTVDRILDHAASVDGDREIVGREADGVIGRTTYRRLAERARRLSNGLLALGVKPGDRVATLGWNTIRHLEAWFAIMGIGAVCHTLNPRLFPTQLRYIVEHAGDTIVLADPGFADLAREITAGVDCRVITLDAAGADVLIDRASADVDWGRFDEQTACALCYTSGTTGNPKGVLYSHRSQVLHIMMTLQPDVFGLSVRDVVMPVVPMYHANAWGLPLSAPMAGAKLVLPGDRMDAASLYDLIEAEGVTFAAAVPTVWQAIARHLTETRRSFSTLRRVVIGGSACPESLIRDLAALGVETAHAWGMTETSPIGTKAKLVPEVAALDFEDQMPFRRSQGRPPFGIALKLTDDAGARVPHDGAALGRLKVRGPTVARAYYGGEGGRILDDEGYFDTGDVASIDALGYMRIADRTKDLIKSGGEWISSIEIETLAIAHPAAAQCAVVAVAHEKWGERPVLVVELKPGVSAEPGDFLGFLEGRIAKWQMPDQVRIVSAVPLGPTGKVDKLAIRNGLKDVILKS